MKTPLILRLLKDDNCEVFYSRGNAGDKLINEGLRQVLGNKIVEKSDTLVFVGAGGFCKFYHHNIDLREKLDNYKKIYIVSATVDMSCSEVKDFISSLPSHVTVICRDKKSFRDVSSAHFSTYIDHDAAFYFDYGPFKKDGTGTLNAFRTDKEAPIDFTVPDGNEDISRLNDHNLFIEKISNYQKVRTNRLHVAIAATMLGLDVELYECLYFKTREIYNYSLKDFKNCKLLEYL